MNDFRIEKDSLGEIKVPSDKYWGAQTQRSKDNFKIGVGYEMMPKEIISAFAFLKSAAAQVNFKLIPNKMTKEKKDVIVKVCEEILYDKLIDQFPLVVFQTGSGTQTNMNVNEVIANRGNELLGKNVLNPNDDINMSQSSNDTFPSALYIAATIIVKEKILPALRNLIKEFKNLEDRSGDIIKVGRTHLQDALPLKFSSEVSGWRSSLENDCLFIEKSLCEISNLAIGGTAVGTGLNAPKKFGALVAKKLTELTGISFSSAVNKYHALTSFDELVLMHSCLKALAADLMKIGNDIRWLSSGPRCGLGEISIPYNEPGSSIMPGKVNPTQCEQLTMVALQVMGNDTSISVAASQGNFELNVYLPLMAYNFIQSARLLSDSINSFAEKCVSGIVPDESKMSENTNRTLMIVTALSPSIGYEKSANVAKKAYAENKTLKKACVELGYLSEEDFDKIVDLKKMC